MQALHWRELEELVASAFKEQGMSVELGTGRGDEGIDLRLTRHEVFGDVLAAVQIKSGRTPVRLHFVQALAAASLADGRSEAIFVTASRYLPGVRNWAAAWEKTMKHRIHLATLEDVATWCAAARDRQWFPDRRLRDPQPQGHGDLIGATMRSYARYASHNRFGLVVRQTPRAVLLRELPALTVSGDWAIGTEVPDLRAMIPAKPHYVAARSLDDEPERGVSSRHRTWYDTDGHSWDLWDDRPLSYNVLD